MSWALHQIAPIPRYQQVVQTCKESAMESGRPHFSVKNFRIQPILPSPQSPEPYRGHQPSEVCIPPASERDGWCFSRVASNNHDAGFDAGGHEDSGTHHVSCICGILTHTHEQSTSTKQGVLTSKYLAKLDLHPPE